MVVQTPLLMDLTLIGQSSLGNGQGAPSAQSGQIPQADKANTNNPLTAPQKDTLNPAVDNAARPEVVMRKIKKKSVKNNAPTDDSLEKLNSAAPIGMENQKAADTNIKTTEGVGHEGIVGAPDGDTHIEGQLAGRTVLRKVSPIYPDWAKKQGVEATVKFDLVVLPNGLLKVGDIDLEQTSGYRDLDSAVYDALIQWEFTPLAPDVIQENQSGVVTFAFNLKNGAQ